MPISHTVLVPVYRGFLHAIIDKGMHWSDIEHLILYALSHDDLTLTELSAYSGLRRSVLVESIIRLMRVGWVDIIETAEQVSFRASVLGRIEAEKDNLSPMVRRIEHKLYYVIDRLLGSLYSPSGLDLLKIEEAEVLSKRDPLDVTVLSPNIENQNLPSHIELIDMLSGNQDILRQDEKIFSYNPDFSELNRESYVRLIVSDDGIKGLPDKNLNKLSDLIYASDEIKKKIELKHECPIPISHLGSDFLLDIHDINLCENDIIIGGPAHKILIRSIMSKAKRHVIIHSTFIRDGNLDELFELFEEAALRRVKVDLLWDCKEDSDDGRDMKAVKAADNFRRRIKEKGLSGRVVLHDFSTASHSKLILSDDGCGRYFVIIGSCNWLNSDFTPMELSIRFRSPKIIIDCLKVFEKLIPSGRRVKYLRERLFSIKRCLKGMPESKGMPARARIITVGDHEHYIHEARDNAKHCIFVASNRAGNAFENQVLAPLRSASCSRGIDATVYYQSKNTKSALTKEVMVALRKQYGNTINIRTIKKAHAKFLCWDRDQAVITSLNWMSKDDYGRNRVGEIGVYIEQPGLADYIKKKYLSHG